MIHEINCVKKIIPIVLTSIYSKVLLFYLINQGDQKVIRIQNGFNGNAGQYEQLGLDYKQSTTCWGSEAISPC